MGPHGKENPKLQSKPPVLSWRIGAAPWRSIKQSGPSTSRPTRDSDSPTEPCSSADEAASQALILQHPRPREVREISASLDPFCELPCALTPEDRFLLHSYLLHVPARVYGNRPEATFSAVRDLSFPISLGSSLTMWWMLIAATGLFTDKGERSEIQSSLVRRKQQAYQLMNDYISQSGGRVSDEILGGIIMAAITEARLSDARAANAHLQGFEAAISARGGLKASLASCSISALRMAHLMPYLVSEPASTDTTLSDAQQMQQFVQFVIKETRHRGFSPVAVSISPEAGLLLLQNTIAGTELLHGPLAFYLNHGKSPTTSFGDEASSFLALFLLTLTLWRISESMDKARLFISHVEKSLADSAAFDPQTGHSLLTKQGLLWAVIHAIQDFQGMHYRMNEDDGLWPILYGVDALRVFRAMTSRETRRQARILLLHILSGQPL
ncbi:hypothetical protein BDV12DRAFT_17067 [Aspergillus spectabilis]